MVGDNGSSMVATSDSQCRTFRYSLGTTVGVGGARGVWKVGADAQSKATKKDIRGQSWEIGMGS